MTRTNTGFDAFSGKRLLVVVGTGPVRESWLDRSLTTFAGVSRYSDVVLDTGPFNPNPKSRSTNMAIVADTFDFVIGGDTHRDTHSLAVIETRTGGVITESVIDNDTTGFEKAFNTGAKLNGSRLWALEGTGSYGINLTRFLQAKGEIVVEVERPARPKNSGPKTDAVDAERAGREVLRLNQEVLGVPRCDGERAAVAAMMTVRDSAVDAAKHAAQQFHAMLLTAPQQIRDRFDGLSGYMKLVTAAKLRGSARYNRHEVTVVRMLKTLAIRHRDLKNEAAELLVEIEQIVKGWRPELLDVIGVGPISAAKLLLVWSHPGRYRSEAAFAAHAGTSPVPASSGMTTRHRINRGGDRQLNAVLHRVVMLRMRTDPDTVAYVKRRTTEGKTVKEIRRCLKRYLARRLFKLLENGLDFS